jgi:hypothetical protein
MKNRLLAVLVGIGMAGAIFAGLATAQSILVPTVNSVGINDLFQDIVNGAPQPGNQYASFGTLSGSISALPAKGNALIGGDATTNIWVYGTTGASETTTFSYGGPNNWAYGSAADAVTLNQDSTASRLPLSGYEYGFQLQRTASQNTGGLVCMGQEVESPNVYQFQGTTAELDFHVATGANFSGASNQMSAYIIYGTGTNEAIGKMFYTISSTIGTSSGWAGVALAASPTIALSTAANGQRISVFGTIPTTATEIGVALCWTAPATAAGTTDSLTFAGIQLVRSPALASYVSTSVAQSNLAVATSFDRRPQALETLYQQRYAYQLAESATAGVYQSPAGIAQSSTTCAVNIPFPVAMYKAPTQVNTSVSATTWVINGGDHADQVLSTGFAAVAGANTVNSASVTFTTGATLTQYYPCMLKSASTPGGGKITWNANL